MLEETSVWMSYHPVVLWCVVPLGEAPAARLEMLHRDSAQSAWLELGVSELLV